MRQGKCSPRATLSTRDGAGDVRPVLSVTLTFVIAHAILYGYIADVLARVRMAHSTAAVLPVFGAALSPTGKSIASMPPSIGSSTSEATSPKRLDLLITQVVQQRLVRTQHARGTTRLRPASPSFHKNRQSPRSDH